MPRLWDERVGFISIQRTNYSRDFDGVRPERYAVRYRLEPSDTAAFLRGELVDPVNRWIWYIDPATPEEIRPLRRGRHPGVERGIRGGRLPERHRGPSGLRPRRRTPSSACSTRGIRCSATWRRPPGRPTPAETSSIPRSGEVIRAHTNLYQGVNERMRWQLLSQVATAADDLRYRDDDLPEDLMGEAIRYVISHETAHSVGLPHNQRANFVFPVDSIRNPDFVRRMGHSASSVGRTRFNYAAQPGDNVPPETAHGCVGRVGDSVGVSADHRGRDSRRTSSRRSTSGSSSAPTSRGSASLRRSSAWTWSGTRTG